MPCKVFKKIYKWKESNGGGAAIGYVDLSKHIDIYKGIRNAGRNYKGDRKTANNKYLIFDDKNYLIWIYWYEGIK